MLPRIITALILFFSANALANGDRLPNDGGNGGLNCSYYDVGDEEHGYHNSCGECQSMHGRCEERCYIMDYECKAVGRDHRGNQVEFSGFARDKFRAKERALNRCHRRMGNCYMKGCHRNSHLDSRRTCR